MFMNGSSGMFGDFDAFSEFLESDNAFMKNMFRDLGGSYRNRGKRRKQGGKKGRVSKGDDHMDEMLSFFMMPGMGSMGFTMDFGNMGGMGPEKKKNKKP